jgi:trehalose 6-phosphate phosphatase
MPDFLFDYSAEVFKKIVQSDAVFLFLDYDGTLVPFKDSPTEVTTPKKIKKVIRQLIRIQKIQVIIVTGRTLVDIKKLLTISGLSFIALHGLCIESSDGLRFHWKTAEQTQSLIAAIKKNMQRILKEEKGAFLEDKGLTIVLHYRLLPKNKVQYLQETFKNIVDTQDKKRILDVINGAKVIEARPKGWNKGKAIELFLAHYMNTTNILPIYIGDDITDEDAFRALRKKGLTIHVTHEKKRKTAAGYWVNDPDDVFFFLDAVTQKINQD